MKNRYTDEQIIRFLMQAATGTLIKDLCHKHGFGDGSFYLWRRRFGGMDVSRVGECPPNVIRLMPV
jgi:putative transposase